MTREVRPRPRQRVRLERRQPVRADPITSGSDRCGVASLLRLQRDAGNAAVVTALGRATRADDAMVQRASEDEEASPRTSSALIDATRAGDLRKVTRLLRHKAAVDQRDEFGTTALIYAIDRRNVSIALLLLDAGADPNLVSDEMSDDGSKGDTALKVAVTNNDPATASLLLGRGARMDVRDHTGLTAPAWAARRGSLACLAIFLGAGWPINHIDDDGFTLLAWAATGGQLGAAQFLIANGTESTMIPQALQAARRQSAAYGSQAAELSARHVPAEERTALVAAVAALSAKEAAVDSVIVYLEQILATGSPP